MQELRVIANEFSGTMVPVTLVCAILFLLIKYGPGRICRFIGLTFWSAGEWWDRFVSEIRLRDALRAANSSAINEFNQGVHHV